MLEKTVESLLVERFEEEDLRDCYVVEVRSAKGEKLEVFVDADSGLTLEKCRIISRYLENEIEERKLMPEKYVLEVSSPGLGRPLSLPRQYIKNIGRNIRVTSDVGDRVEGILAEANAVEILIVEKLKKEEKQHRLNYDQIKEAKILVSFKKK